MTGFSKHFGWPSPGMVVSVPAYAVFRHKGIVSDCWKNGKPMAISNSAMRGGVVEEGWDDFAQGQQVTISPTPSNLPAWEVLARARAHLGSRYELVRWNCDHLIAHSFGLPPQSPQLALALVGITLGVLFMTGSK